MKPNEEFALSTAKALLEIAAVKLSPENPFTWASGWKSPIYCDNRKAYSYSDVRDDIVDALVGVVVEKYQSADVIAGVATGAIGWGALVADRLGLPYIYVRSEAKNHGLENLIEGVLLPNQKVVVIEDLISTGGSSIKAVKAVRNAGGDVLGMAAIFSYGFQKAQDAFATAGCELITLSNYNALIECAVAAHYVDESLLPTLAKWRLSPDTWGKEAEK